MSLANEVLVWDPQLKARIILVVTVTLTWQGDNPRYINQWKDALGVAKTL